MVVTSGGRGSSCMSIVMGVLMILFGIGAGLFSAYAFYRSWQLTSNGSKVEAVVSDMEFGSSDGGGRPAAPVFEYTINGQVYHMTSGNESYPPRYKIGDHETILVDPQNPKNARENNFLALWLLPILMCPASIVSIGGAVLVMAVTRLKGKNST